MISYWFSCHMQLLQIWNSLKHWSFMSVPWIMVWIWFEVVIFQWLNHWCSVWSFCCIQIKLQSAKAVWVCMLCSSSPFWEPHRLTAARLDHAAFNWICECKKCYVCVNVHAKLKKATEILYSLHSDSHCSPFFVQKWNTFVGYFMSLLSHVNCAILWKYADTEDFWYCIKTWRH